MPGIESWSLAVKLSTQLSEPRTQHAGMQGADFGGVRTHKAKGLKGQERRAKTGGVQLKHGQGVKRAGKCVPLSW